MATDDVRNAAYAMAIEQSITPGCVVLDLGAGLGVHGLMAYIEQFSQSTLADKLAFCDELDAATAERR